jgi:hypothetical protein
LIGLRTLNDFDFTATAGWSCRFRFIVGSAEVVFIARAQHAMQLHCESLRNRNGKHDEHLDGPPSTILKYRHPYSARSSSPCAHPSKSLKSLGATPPRPVPSGSPRPGLQPHRRIRSAEAFPSSRSTTCEPAEGRVTNEWPESPVAR